MRSGYMALAEGSLNGVLSGIHTAQDGIAAVLKAEGVMSGVVGTFKIALGFGEAGISASNLVLPFAGLGKLPPGSPGLVLAGATAGSSTAAAGAIAAAKALAPKSLTVTTIMMAVGGDLTGKTPGGLDRLSSEWRRKHAPHNIDYHHHEWSPNASLAS